MDQFGASEIEILFMFGENKEKLSSTCIYRACRAGSGACTPSDISIASVELGMDFLSDFVPHPRLPLYHSESGCNVL